MKTSLLNSFSRLLWLTVTVTGVALACHASPMSGLSQPSIYSLKTAADTATSPFTVVASSKKPEFQTGEPVALELEVTNTSNEKADLQFSSGQSFDFSVSKAGSKDVIWSWGMNKRFMQMMRTVSLEPGKSLKFEASWKNAAPGTYTVLGMVTANGGLSAPAFTVIVK